MTPSPAPRYEVVIDARASKELRNLDKPVVRRIHEALWKLTEDPRPEGCRKLKGEDDLWRIRVGNYRILYSIHDHKVLVTVVTIAHRRDAYRDLG